METIAQVIILGALVEAIGESIWWVIPDGEGNVGWNKKRIVAAVLAFAIAGITGLDLFAVVNLPIGPWIPEQFVTVPGIIATAFLGMRGATAISDFLGWVQEIRANAKS